MISSKRLTQYSDFPMPDAYPEHPHHELVWRYLRDYAAHFGIDRAIQFNTGVRWMEPAGEEGWIVILENGQHRRYQGIVIANGHNWDPRWPECQGSFAGRVLHSAEYKTTDVLRGRRVLVVGSGNSGCDIAVESANHAEATFHSVRRRYHFLPRFFRGRAIDQCGERILAWRWPLGLRRFAARRVATTVFGPPEQSLLAPPDHQFLETHPIINSWYPHLVASRSLRLKPDVAELKPDRVRFTDGSEERVDVIIYATGYKLSFPFIDQKYLNWHSGQPQLYLNVFHPVRDDLFVAGMIQPDSGQFGLVGYQGQLMAQYVRGLREGRDSAKRLQREKKERSPDSNGGIAYVRTPRHLLEVEHYSYRRHLKRWIGRLAR